MMNEQLKSKIEQVIPQLTTVRRDLHKHPESGWTEFRTASMAIKKMQELGYTITMGEKAVDRESMMGVPSADVLRAHMERARHASVAALIVVVNIMFVWVHHI